MQQQKKPSPKYCNILLSPCRSMRPVAETGELSRLRFKMYSVYSWGCPVFISLVAVIVDSLPEDFDVIRPGFGIDRCWFAGECQTDACWWVSNGSGGMKTDI